MSGNAGAMRERGEGVFFNSFQNTTADNIHQSRNHNREFLPKWTSGGRLLQASEKVAAD